MRNRQEGKSAKQTQTQSVLGGSNGAGEYLGQRNTKLVVLFGELLERGQVSLKGKIVDTNLEALRRRIPPNRFGKKLMVEVSAQHEAVLTLSTWTLEARWTRRSTSRWSR